MVQMIGEKLLIIDLFIDQSKLVGRWQKETQTKEIDCQGWTNQDSNSKRTHTKG